MHALFTYLYSLNDSYIRTIFNFHITRSNLVDNIYDTIKAKIANETLFGNVTDPRFNTVLKKLIYCDIHITKHILNPNPTCYTLPKLKPGKILTNYFDINLLSDSPETYHTKEIFLSDKSSLVSYIKTTNKKIKINYGEIKKTINSHYKSSYYSGKRSDEYLSTEVYKHTEKPWVKTISKKLRVDIKDHSIVTRGKSSILQTIEIIYNNRTCIKIFKDSTIHVILSKEKSEVTCIDTVDRLFNTYYILFDFLQYITGNSDFERFNKIIHKILQITNFEEKMKIIKENYSMYGIYNFRIGMLNIMYKKPIYTTIIPSLLDTHSKIKFFKGKKLNIVALNSLEECIYYVNEANTILNSMAIKSNELDDIDIITSTVEAIKTIIIRS